MILIGGEYLMFECLQGGGKRCLELNCLKPAVAFQRCATHGGRRVCFEFGCKKWVIRKGCCEEHQEDDVDLLMEIVNDNQIITMLSI